MNILERIQEHGGAATLEQGKVFLLHRSRLPGDVVEEARQRKDEIQQVLDRDQTAKRIGLVIGLPGEIYTLTLNNNSSLFVEVVNGDWQGWRENQASTYQSSKILARGNFYHVMDRVKDYIAFLERVRGKTT